MAEEPTRAKYSTSQILKVKASCIGCDTALSAQAVFFFLIVLIAYQRIRHEKNVDS
jgi:hypothetical protein